MNKRPGRSGYYTVAGCLNDRFKKRGPLSPLELSQLTPQACTRIFEQDSQNRPIAELILKNLTIFADNLVPHVLRVDNILIYPEVLASHIDAGKLIPAGSVEEIEIRACALHAVERLKAALNASGHAITSMELDFLLWNRGQQPAYKSIARHRTRTVFY